MTNPVYTPSTVTCNRSINPGNSKLWVCIRFIHCTKYTDQSTIESGITCGVWEIICHAVKKWWNAGDDTASGTYVVHHQHVQSQPTGMSNIDWWCPGLGMIKPRKTSVARDNNIPKWILYTQNLIHKRDDTVINIIEKQLSYGGPAGHIKKENNTSHRQYFTDHQVGGWSIFIKSDDTYHPPFHDTLFI